MSGSQMLGTQRKQMRETGTQTGRQGQGWEEGPEVRSAVEWTVT